MPSAARALAPEYGPIDLGLLNDVIGFRLRRIQNHLSRGFYERLRGMDLRPGVYSALALIAANPGLSQTTLARQIGFDKATVVAIVDALESLGWAERRPAEADRRRRALSATPRGERALTTLQRAAVANEARLLAALTGAERDELFRLLDKAYLAYVSTQ